MFLITKHTECNCESQFDEYESELDPEAIGEDVVFAVVYSETLILPADKDCGYDISPSG